MTIIVYVILFGLLLLLAIGSLQVRYLALLIGTILFPLGISFLQSPTLRPMDLFLYGFFAVTLFKDYRTLCEDIKAFPLKFPLVFLLLCHFASVYINEGFNAKQLYAATREFIELYGYIFASYLVTRHTDISNILKKVYFIAIAICIFGIIEILLQGNYPYTFICRAFPIYTGYYSLDDIISCIQDYRVRATLTTAHPTAYGTLLTCLTVLFGALWNKANWKRSHLLILYVLLAINLFLCGSRTGMVCAALGVVILFLRKRHILFKIASIGLFVIFTTLYVNIIINEFSQQSKGSSLTLREQQLLFTFVQIQRSPILGNGVGYTKNVFDYDDDGRPINDATIGGLESIIYRSLIDYGFVGLGAYYFFALWFFVAVFRRRKKNFAGYTGYTLILVSTLFFTLSGHIGNNTAFAFLLEGLMLGNIIPAEDKPDSEDEVAEKIEEDLQEDESKLLENSKDA